MSLFKKKQFTPLLTDLHSHLIPKIDDGADSLESSMQMLKALKKLGFKKIITTPHIHPKYPNTPGLIIRGLEEVRQAIKKNHLDLELEAAAEYFVDERFLERLDKKEDLLTFGNRFLLIECSFVTRPLFFETAILRLKSQGYNPILAHPERYQFLQGDLFWLEKMREAGLYFQVTLSSLTGYYGKTPRKLGEILMKRNLIDFLASDLHKPAQLDWMEKSLRLKGVQKLIQSGKLLNQSLL